jgi:hypothetical protein
MNELKTGCNDSGIVGTDGRRHHAGGHAKPRDRRGLKIVLLRAERFWPGQLVPGPGRRAPLRGRD